MKNIGLDMKGLLDKLYNFKSDDSVILKRIEKDQDIANETKNSLVSEKEELTVNIDNLTNEIVLLETDGNVLIEEIKKLCVSNFDDVLVDLSVDFKAAELLDEVSSKLPTKLEELSTDKASKLKRLELVEKDLADVITLIDELSFKKDDAVATQDKLKEYFELSLNGNINITRDILIGLLSKFELSEDEKRNSAKMLMFPEDGLYDYNEQYVEAKKSGKSFSDVFAEAKVRSDSDVKVYDEPVKEVVHEEVRPIKLDDVKPVKLTPPVVTELPKLDEVKPRVSNVNVKDLLEKNKFKYNNFTNRDIEFIEDNVDEKIFVKNVKLIKDMGINIDIFEDNIELFIDDELEEKLNVLIEVGKVPFDIYLNPNILVKYDASELKSSIKSLRESGLDPKKVPLMAY